MSDAIHREVYILGSRLDRALNDLSHLKAVLHDAGWCAIVPSTNEDRAGGAGASAPVPFGLPQLELFEE